jgi:hypothetical protein
MEDYYSIVAKAVRALDLNTEKARRRLYDRARAALRSEMHSAYPRFHRSEIVVTEMALEMAIEAVEAEVLREQNARSATLALCSRDAGVAVVTIPPANQNGKARFFATLWAGIFRRAGEGAQGPRGVLSGHSDDGVDNAECRDIWLTELLARASRVVDNDEQDFAPRWASTQSGGAN